MQDAVDYQLAAAQSALYARESLDEGHVRDATQWQKKAAMFSYYARVEMVRPVAPDFPKPSWMSDQEYRRREWVLKG